MSGEAVENIGAGIFQFIANDKFEILYADDIFYDVVRCPKDVFFDKFSNSFLEIVAVEDRDKLKRTFINEDMEAYSSVEIRLNLSNISVPVNNKSSRDYWLYINGSFLTYENNYNVYSCTFIDTTEYTKNIEELEMFIKEYKTIAKFNKEILFEYDLESDAIKIDEVYKKTLEVAFGKDLNKGGFKNSLIKSGNFAEETLNDFIDNFEYLEKFERFFTGELKVKNNKGGYSWVSYQATAMKSDIDGKHKIIGKIVNIDRYKNEIRILEERATKDPLTNLYNKSSIEKFVNTNINKSKNTAFALLIIDVDYFKDINDTFGHVFGDDVLREATFNISAVFNKDELMGRIGGDEFVVFFEFKDDSLIKQKVKVINELFRRSYTIDEKTRNISSSIGISIYPSDGKTYKDLLEKADIALYNVKSAGRNGYKIYNERMKESSEASLSRERVHSDITQVGINQIINTFFGVQDLNKATRYAIDMICKLYKFDKNAIFLKDNVSNTFFKIYEHDLKTISKDYLHETGFKMNLRSYASFFENSGITNEEVEKVFEDDSYVHFSEFDSEEFSSNFRKIALLDSQSSSNLKESFVFHTGDRDNVKGYIVFEKYNLSQRLTHEEILSLKTICMVINNRLEKFDIDRQSMKKTGIKNLAIENQNLGIYIVRKSNFEILYYNSILKNNVPSIKNGLICEEIKARFGGTSKDKPKSIDLSTLENKSIVVDNFFGTDKTWILKVSPMSWEDTSDAYMICGRDTSTYIEETSDKDILTGTISLENFKTKAQIMTSDESKKFAIVTLGINKFKSVNETWGYTIGDEILAKFSRILGSSMREEELFCRMKEDKFCALMKYTSKSNLESRIQHILSMSQDMQHRYFRDMKLSMAIGFFVIDTPIETAISKAIENANIARDSAKSSYENKMQQYDDNLAGMIEKEKFVESRMLDALKDDEFVPYFQPKFDFKTGDICGAEALVRWESKTDTIYPDEFINIFEKNGFITTLDFVIYEKVFKHLNDCIKENIELIPVSLNVSRRHVDNVNFTQNILALLKKYEIPTNLIELEITEGIFMEDKILFRTFIDQLRAEQIKISIDDFGTAYSSLGMIKDIDVDAIKIDKHFLSNINNVKLTDFPSKDKIIIKYIVDLANELNFDVICEGVENKEQMEFLKTIGCNYGQGYVVSPALPFDEFKKTFLKSAKNQK